MAQSESVLLAKYAEHRDPSAFRALVERHQGMVFGVCNRILRNASDAEDVAQECFLRLAQKAADLRAPITGWLHRVAVQTSIDLARRDRARRARERRSREATRQPGDTVVWEDLMAHVDEALVQLPPDLRHPLIMHYLEGRNQADVAAELGIAQGTVSKRLSRGAQALRDALKSAGMTAPTAVVTSLLSANAVEAAPATLTASLGKMALVGPTTGAGETAVTAGSLTIKTKLVVAAAVVAGVAGTIATMQMREKPRGPAPVLPAAAPRQTAKNEQKGPIIGPGISPEEAEQIQSFVAKYRAACAANDAEAIANSYDLVFLGEKMKTDATVLRQALANITVEPVKSLCKHISQAPLLSIRISEKLAGPPLQCKRCALAQLKGVALYLRKGASGWRIISQELGDEEPDKIKARASEMPIVKHWRQYAGTDVPAPRPDAKIGDVSSLDLEELGLRQVGVIEGPLDVTLDGRTFKFARALERRAVMCSDNRGRQYEFYFARAEDATTARSICKDAFPAVQMAPAPVKMSSGVLFLSRTGHRSNIFFCSGPWVTVVSISILPPSGKTLQEIQLSHDVLEEERIGLELLRIFAEHYRGL